MSSFQKTVVTLLVIGVLAIVGAGIVAQQNRFIARESNDYFASPANSSKAKAPVVKKGTPADFLKIISGQNTASAKSIKITRQSDCANSKLPKISKDVCNKLFSLKTPPAKKTAPK
jgi:hypothetical protein